MSLARVLISMQSEFLEDIDKIADLESRSRSELIREALRTYISKKKIEKNAQASKNAIILEGMII